MVWEPIVKAPRDWKVVPNLRHPTITVTGLVVDGQVVGAGCSWRPSIACYRSQASYDAEVVRAAFSTPSVASRRKQTWTISSPSRLSRTARH